jgi:hypothetical protein
MSELDDLVSRRSIRIECAPAPRPATVDVPFKGRAPLLERDPPGFSKALGYSNGAESRFDDRYSS